MYLIRQLSANKERCAACGREVEVLVVEHDGRTLKLCWPDLRRQLRISQATTEPSPEDNSPKTPVGAE